jgi:hypothetical protein
VRTGKHADRVPGALIQVDNNELDVLKERERHYKLEDVSDYIVSTEAEGNLGKVETFVSESTSYAQATSYVRAGYVRFVTEALDAMSIPDRIPLLNDATLIEAEDADTVAESVWRTKESEIWGAENQLHIYLRERNAVRFVGKKSGVIGTSVRPIVLSKSLFDEVKVTAACTVSLCIKALKVVMHDSSLRELSGLRDADFAIAEHDVANDDILPQIARVDLTFDRSKLSVFEANCGSPAGMFHLDMLVSKQAEFSSEKLGIHWLDYDSNESVCDAVIDALSERWRTFCCQTDGTIRPLRRIAIVDRNWKRQTTRPEFEYFQKVMSERGYEAFICNPEDLTVVNGKLQYLAKDLDVVYKRVLWSDHSDAKDLQMAQAEARMFDAHRRRAACFVNSFGCQLAGNKFLFAVMKDPGFEARLDRSGLALSDDERKVLDENMPFARVWEAGDDSLKSSVLDEPENYVLKDFQGHGAQGVLMGDHIETPERKFEDLLDKGFIVQERVNHGSAQMPASMDGKLRWARNYFILGAYVIAGRSVAVEAKVQADVPISMTEGANRTAVFSTTS